MRCTFWFIDQSIHRSALVVVLYELRDGLLRDFVLCPNSFCCHHWGRFPDVRHGLATYYGADETGCSALVWKQHVFLSELDHRKDIHEAVDSGEVAAPEELRAFNQQKASEITGVDRMQPVYIVLYTVSRV